MLQSSLSKSTSITGHSNQALAAFLDCRENIVSSLVNGAKDDELYVKVAKELSEAELLLFNYLGSLNCELGDNKSAVEALQEASRIRSNLLGDHEDTARGYHSLGVAQYNLGDLDGALESLQTASRMRKDVFGDHPVTAKSLKLLNRVYEALSASELDCD